MKRLPHSYQERSIEQVWDWFQAVGSALGRDRQVVHAAAGHDSEIPSPVDLTGQTEEQVDEYFADLKEELARMACLGILAAAEATLCIDFRARVETRKPRGPLTNVYREAWRRIRRRSRLRVRLEEDLLEAIGTVVRDRAVRAALGAFKGALRYRHWLAHGCYWIPRLGREYDPRTVYDISYELLSVLGLPAAPHEA